MPVLRDTIVRLAYTRPDLRPHLLPLLSRSAQWEGGHGFGGLSGPTLKPGDGIKRVRAGEELHGWDKYCQLVAEAYKAAPSKTPAGEKAFAALLRHIQTMFPQVKSRVNVEFVGGDIEQVYPTADLMDQRVRDTHTLLTDTAYNQSDAFGPEGNLELRSIHDYLAHLKGHPGSGHANAFNLEGELRAYNAHLHLVGCQAKAAPALFTEIVGQVCHQVYFGAFPKQKIVVLDDFDYCHLGRVRGYSIRDGDLV